MKSLIVESLNQPLWWRKIHRFVKMGIFI